MWRAERLRVFLRQARGGQLRESTPISTQVDEDGVTEDMLLLSTDKCSATTTTAPLLANGKSYETETIHEDFSFAEADFTLNPFVLDSAFHRFLDGSLHLDSAADSKVGCAVRSPRRPERKGRRPSGGVEQRRNVFGTEGVPPIATFETQTPPPAPDREHPILSSSLQFQARFPSTDSPPRISPISLLSTSATSSASQRVFPDSSSPAAEIFALASELPAIPRPNSPRRFLLSGIQQQCFPRSGSTGNLASLLLRSDAAQRFEYGGSRSTEPPPRGERRPAPPKLNVSTQTKDRSSCSSPSRSLLFPLRPTSDQSSTVPPHMKFLVHSGAKNDFALAMYYLSGDDSSLSVPAESSPDSAPASASDYAAAARYFYCAAARGMPKAKYNLGICYLTGKGVEKDEKLGMDFVRQAAEKGHPKAMYTYAHHLLHGRPSRISSSSSSSSSVGGRMMLRAAEAGNVEAMVYCAVDLCFTPEKACRLRPLCGRPNAKGATTKGEKAAHSKGVGFLKSAIERESAEAAFLMGRLLADGKAGLEMNERLAEENFEKARKWGIEYVQL